LSEAEKKPILSSSTQSRKTGRDQPLSDIGLTTVVGIDPGLAATGIGIVRATGLKIREFSYCSVYTPSDIPTQQRLKKIYSEIVVILKKTAPSVMVLEDVFFLKDNPKSGILLGKVAGVALLAGIHADIPAIEIPVREAKQVLTGNGNASKMQLEKAVRHFLNRTEPIRPYHASDALALALIGVFRYGKSG